ncbi:MAG: hypothetical protein GF353_24245, partial [Candidatus Lokiarchaeota archaeon]|nr:hypothetical protein [Candidatus Lokiarchaeota archaeon]
QFSLFPTKESLKPINLSNLGKIDVMEGQIICTNHLRKPHVAERIKNSAEKHISSRLDIKTAIKTNYVDSLSAGVGLSLWAHSDSGSIISTGTILGEKQLSSEKVGKIAANEILKYVQNEIPVDNYLSDQILPLMGLAQSSSKMKVLELTSHTRTNLELMKKFTNRNYRVEKRDNHSIVEII